MIFGIRFFSKPSHGQLYLVDWRDIEQVFDPENGSTTYAYDTLNRLQTLTPLTAFSGTGSFGFTYDALSRRAQMTRPNNVATNYAYDNLSRLQSVLHQLSGSIID